MAITIADEGGRRFWIEQFGSSKSVKWPIFIDYFEDYFKDQGSSDLPGAVRVEQVLRYTTDRSPDSCERDVITVEEWDTFLQRFGPLELVIRKACRSCFTADGQMMPWFHGRITRQQAKDILAKKSHPGAFLVRFSETNPHQFSLTFLDTPAAGGTPSKSKHVLLYNLGAPGFALRLDAQPHDRFASLRDLVEVHPGWSRPCRSALAVQFAEEMKRLMQERQLASTTGDVRLLLNKTAEGLATVAEEDDSESESSEGDYSTTRTDYSNSLPSTPGGGGVDDGEEEEEDEEEEEGARSSGSSNRGEGSMNAEDLIPQVAQLLRRSSLSESVVQLNRAMMAAASGKPAEALPLVDEVLSSMPSESSVASSSSLEELELRCRAAKVKANVLEEMGRPQQACHFYELSASDAHKMLQLAPAMVDISDHFPNLRYLHHQLVSYYLQAHSYDRAVEHYEQFLGFTEDVQERRILLKEFEKLAREHDLWHHRVSALVVESDLEQGVALYRASNFEEAAERFQRVVMLARLTLLDRKLEGRALGNLATVTREIALREAEESGSLQFDEAIFYYRMSCRLFKALGDRQMERKMLNGLSLCCMDAGRFADARVFCEALLTLTQKEDNVKLVRARLSAIDAKIEEERSMEGDSRGGGTAEEKRGGSGDTPTVG